MRSRREYGVKIMNKRKDLVIAVVISVIATAPLSAQSVQKPTIQKYSAPKQNSLSIHRATIWRSAWCLHDYDDDSINCSFSSRNQCAATASGGLGECVRIRRRATSS